MKKAIVLLFFIFLLSMTSYATEMATEQIQTFGFTSNGYYCKADLTFQWDYSGSNLEFYENIKENVSGYIGSRLQLLFLEDISSYSNLELKESLDNGQLSNDSKISLDLIEKVNKEIDVTGVFKSVSLNSLDIYIVELFESTIMDEK